MHLIHANHRVFWSQSVSQDTVEPLFPLLEGLCQKPLLGMADYMDTFKAVMDSSSPDEMNQLCERYDGFYRFGKLLEALAQGIQDGRIRVP